MSLAGAAPDEAMSSTGEPTIFPSPTTSSAGAPRGGVVFAGRGGGGAAALSIRGGAAAVALAAIAIGADDDGFTLMTPSSVRRPSVCAAVLVRLSDEPHVTQKR